MRCCSRTIIRPHLRDSRLLADRLAVFALRAADRAAHVIGPTGAKTLMSHLEQAYAADIKIRLVDEKLPPEGVATRVEEYDRDGVVYDRGGLKVIAFEVDHGDVIKPCYGYRIEYGGRVVVHSSDTRYNENVVKYGAGADLLIHEVAAARPELIRKPTSSASSRTTRRRARPGRCSRAPSRSSPPTRTSSCSAAKRIAPPTSMTWCAKPARPTTGRCRSART